MTRNELYALVWRTPSVHVARQMGIPNSALRKLCADFKVPLPPVGYWTKIAYGKEVTRTPLPNATPKIIENVNRVLRRFGQTSLAVTDAQIADYNLDLSPAAHTRLPLVSEVERALRSGKPDKAGFVARDWPALLHVRVARQSFRRAVSFVSELFHAGLSAGFKISKQGGMALSDEHFAVRIYETADKSRPSGRLCFEIYDPRPLVWSPDNLVGHWHDAKRQRIEAKIRIAIAETVNAVPIIQTARRTLEAEAENARVRELQKQRAGLARQREEFIDMIAAKISSRRSLQDFADYLMQQGLNVGDAPLNRLARDVAKRAESLGPEMSLEELAALVSKSGLFDRD